MTLTPHTLLLAILTWWSPIEAATGSAISPDENLKSTVKEGLTAIAELPNHTAAPTQDCSSTTSLETHEIAASLQLINDNKPWSLNDGTKGDDLGHTHGYRLNFSYTSKDKERLIIYLTNDLYSEFNSEEGVTQREGMRFVPQFFTEEIRLGMSLDTFEKDYPVYVKLGGGFHQLNHTPSDDILLSTGRQQSEFHHAVNQSGFARFNERVQTANGETSQHGFFANASLGLKREVFSLNDGLLEVIVYSDAGFDVSSIPGATALVINQGLRISSLTPDFGIGRFKQSLDVGAESRLYKDTFQTTAKATLMVGHENAQLVLGYEQDRGDAPGYRLYDNPNVNTGENDSMLTVGLRFALH